jgi:hypothetical protein
VYSGMVFNQNNVDIDEDVWVMLVDTVDTVDTVLHIFL